jgi:hypothetical protein
MATAEEGILAMFPGDDRDGTVEFIVPAPKTQEVEALPGFDTGDSANLYETMKRYLDAFPGDVVCSLQIWREALGGYGVPAPTDLKAMEKVPDELDDWKAAGEIRYEKFGKQPSYKRAL